MKATLSKIFGPVAVCWFVFLLICGFLAYFVSRAGSPPTDGLGRPITAAPFLMRIVFGQEHMWAGWGWFAAEMIIFWGSIAVALKLARWLKD
jgi:hypothetical protein